MYSLTVAVLAASLVAANAQIPTACTDQSSLENLKCCPDTDDGVCGVDANRGSCAAIPGFDFDNSTTQARVNWPHYYTKICKCNGNYGGSDCSKCQFGYYGESCEQFQVLPREPVRKLDDAGWTKLMDIIYATRSSPSGYSVPTAEAVPGTWPFETIEVSIYEYFVWSHHYSAKDAALPVNLDYAHGGPAFFTWHRLMNLYFEWHIQYMLKDMGEANYFDFRLPYWDWRFEMQNSAIGLPAEELFTEERMGATTEVNGFPKVTGRIFDEWNTTCWLLPNEVCDPRDDTGPLSRCPVTGNEPCKASNPDWPNQNDVDFILSQVVYDAPDYSQFAQQGFRRLIDLNVSRDFESCGNDRMCQCFTIVGSLDFDCLPANNPQVAADFNLHSVVHLITGLGDLNSNVPIDKQGQIADVAASPNDPFFFVHHTMVDCIFEEWRTANPDAVYPVDDAVRDGHRASDYSRGWFPLYTNTEIFSQAETFGYTCELADSGAVCFVSSPLLLLVTILAALVAK